MSNKVFGVNSHGRVTLCRALPENRGRYSCTHVEGSHREFSEQQLKGGELQRYAEQKLREHMLKHGISPEEYTHSSMRREKTAPAAPKVNFHELQKSAEELADNFPEEDYRFIQQFYSLYSELRAGETDMQTVNPRAHLLNFLESSNPNALWIREYLGPEVDAEALVDLLVEEVGAMTTSHRWSTAGRSSIPRALLSTLHNDMDREHYVASVLFFRGRCCYCQIPLSRSAAGRGKPTGEHITPIWPEEPNAVSGSTRYGNMALACKLCNNDRGNKSLEKWFPTSPVKKNLRVESLARIEAFRRFANYRDYSPEEGKLIRDSVLDLLSKTELIRDENGQLKRGHGEIIRQDINKHLKRLEKLIPRESLTADSDS